MCVEVKEVYPPLSKCRTSLLFKTLENTFPTTLRRVVMRLYLPRSSISPFLNRLTIRPSLHCGGKTPLAKLLQTTAEAFCLCSSLRPFRSTTVHPHFMCTQSPDYMMMVLDGRQRGGAHSARDRRARGAVLKPPVTY